MFSYDVHHGFWELEPQCELMPQATGKQGKQGKQDVSEGFHTFCSWKVGPNRWTNWSTLTDSHGLHGLDWRSVKFCSFASKNTTNEKNAVVLVDGKVRNLQSFQSLQLLVISRHFSSLHPSLRRRRRHVTCRDEKTKNGETEETTRLRCLKTRDVLHRCATCGKRAFCLRDLRASRETKNLTYLTFSTSSPFSLLRPISPHLTRQTSRSDTLRWSKTCSA